MSRDPATDASRWSLALVALVLLVKLGFAAHWALLADEALYWVWSLHLDAGYFDQPPLIAWVNRVVTTVLGRSELALRLIPVSVTGLIIAAGWSWAGDRALWAVWVLAVPVLSWLTWFATPDAYLLGFWSLGLAAGLRGGRAWLWAGIFAGLAVQSKYSGLWLMPALMIASPDEVRTRWPWLGLGLMALLCVPNLVWSTSHDWIALRYAFEEGLAHRDPPGVLGPPLQLLGQVGVASPVLAGLGLSWCVWAAPRLSTLTRVQRVAWWTSAPLLAGFAIAAYFGPPEAHWPAPAWIGIGLALSHQSGRWIRIAWMGTGLGLVMSLLLAAHTISPLLRVPNDPAVRLTEGRILGRAVAVWALPDGISAWQPGVERASPVWTERYQEAALIHYYTGISAHVVPGCGRPNQYTLWPRPIDTFVYFVRPSTGGPPHCLEPREVSRAHPIRTADKAGRTVGPWQIFEVKP